MHAKSGLRVFLKWKIYRPDSVIAAVIPLTEALFEMPHVFLNPDGTQSIGAIVVVASATGVTYSTQCAGLSNEHRALEGFVIPVGGEKLADEIHKWFWTRFHGNCYPPMVEWNQKLIEELKVLISRIPCWRTESDGEDERLFLNLDENRMQECAEAWIPVSTPYGDGILTLKNSD